MKLRIATRKSKLALTQTGWVGEQLRQLKPGLEVELVHVVTEGDRVQDVSLAEIGGKGLFVSEVEQAVLEGRADLAVHSLKDVPADLADGLCLGCVPKREDPRDALITRDGMELDDLTAGDCVGTNSARRTLQLRRLRNDLRFEMLRGNVDTRIGKLEAGQYQAIVLAMSGLRRLGLANRPLWPVPVEACIPAVGQGALAVEARMDDETTLSLLQKLEHGPSRLCIEAERAFQRALGGDCHTPLAGHAPEPSDGRIRFIGLVGSPTDNRVVQGTNERYLAEPSVQQAQDLGREVAEDLLSQGAAKLIAEAAALTAAYDPRRRS